MAAWWEGAEMSGVPGLGEVESVAVRTDAVNVDDEFAAFVAESQGALGRAALLLCGNASTAEDMTQTALMRTYLAWGRIRNGNPYAYARRVLINLRTDTWRRLRREVLMADHSLPEPGGSDGAADIALHMEIAEAFRRLKGIKRQVVVLRVVFDLSERDVAEELGIPIGTVKSAYSRGLAQLRRTLEPRIDDTAHECEGDQHVE